MCRSCYDWYICKLTRKTNPTPLNFNLLTITKIKDLQLTPILRRSDDHLYVLKTNVSIQENKSAFGKAFRNFLVDTAFQLFRYLSFLKLFWFEIYNTRWRIISLVPLITNCTLFSLFNSFDSNVTGEQHNSNSVIVSLMSLFILYHP